MNVRSRAAIFLIVVFLGLCLYLPLLTRNYDINGSAEAAAVDSGSAVDLWNPNHMLYRPVGYALREVLAATGIVVASVPFLQVLSAIFGALGLGFVYLTLEHLTSNRTIAVWMSLALGVSWSYWTLSTDVYYFSLAAMLVAASLAVFVCSESSAASVVCGLLAGGAILACQANVVLLPGLGVAVVVAGIAQQKKNIVQRILLIWISAGAITGAAFIGAGVLIYQKHSITELMQWATRYSGNRLPMWGSWWPPRRLLQTVGSAFRSIVGMDTWMFPVFQRHLKNGELPSWVAMLGFIVVAAGLMVAFRKSTEQKKGQNSTILWLLVLYAAYIPFVTWWESIEPRWFIVPNIFLAALTAVILSRYSSWRYFRFALPAGVVMLAGLNLAISAGPKHFMKSNSTQMAACVASHMEPNDLFLATEWNWADYLHYIHNRLMVSFIGEVSKAGNKTDAMAKVREMERTRQQQGGKVYMIDIASYPESYMKWLNEQTGLTAEDLRTYAGKQSFECVGSQFLLLN